MMKAIWLFLLLIVVGCQWVEKQPVTKTNADEAFSRLAEEYIAGHLAWRPQQGTALGLHQYDGRISDLSSASIEAERKRLHHFQEALQRINPSTLAAKSHYDLRILQAAIANELFNFDEMDGFRRNPMSYAGALDVNIYIKRNFAPLPERVRSIIAIEKQAPKIFAAARKNLG